MSCVTVTLWYHHCWSCCFRYLEVPCGSSTIANWKVTILNGKIHIFNSYVKLPEDSRKVDICFSPISIKSEPLGDLLGLLRHTAEVVDNIALKQQGCKGKSHAQNGQWTSETSKKLGFFPTVSVWRVSNIIQYLWQIYALLIRGFLGRWNSAKAAKTGHWLS